MSSITRVGRMFPRNSVVDVVRTSMHFDASPNDVWRGMLFYEEVPKRPMALLRWFLPVPVRTEGEKTREGSVIRCTYENAFLTKRITSAKAGEFVRFDVLVQELGIEDCISMSDGGYELTPAGEGTDLVLTTRYRGHMRPRWLWRPFERFLAHRMHRHILDGMREVVASKVERPLLADA